MPNFFDTHCHLQFEVFEQDVGRVIDQAHQAGVKWMLVPGTDVDSSAAAVKLARRYSNPQYFIQQQSVQQRPTQHHPTWQSQQPQRSHHRQPHQQHPELFAAVGVHPHHVFEFQNQPLTELTAMLREKLDKLITQPEVIAIGEAGLDRYQYSKTKHQNYELTEKFMTLQRSLFEFHLQLAFDHRLPVIIHNRQATTEMLVILTEFMAEDDARRDFLADNVVFHCCEPDPVLLEFALAHHFFIGVDGDVTYRPQKQEFVKTIPLEKLVIETDAPFLKPRSKSSSQVRDRRCQPADLITTAQILADLKGMAVTELAAITAGNAHQLFNLTQT